jgi:hypothetical protein
VAHAGSGGASRILWILNLEMVHDETRRDQAAAAVYRLLRR